MDFVCTEGEFQKMRNQWFPFFLSVLGFIAFSTPLAAEEKMKTPEPIPSSVPTPEVYRPMMEYSRLTEEERKILARGPIEQTPYIIGGAVGTFLGWGIGHAVQGRYSDQGWIFTLGEGVSLVALVAAVNSCLNRDWWNDDCNGEATLATIGFFSYVGFRIWEIVDLWATPGSHNNRYYQLKALTEPRRVSFIATPTKSGAFAGLQFRF